MKKIRRVLQKNIKYREMKNVKLIHKLEQDRFSGGLYAKKYRGSIVRHINIMKENRAHPRYRYFSKCGKSWKWVDSELVEYIEKLERSHEIVSDLYSDYIERVNDFKVRLQSKQKIIDVMKSKATKIMQCITNISCL